MAQHNQTGIIGEKLAEEYLLKKGFVILHKNWRFSHWEVDIIASQNNFLHFIEVKTRRTKTYGLPEEDVTRKKIENLIYASEEYTFQNPQWTKIQFDILSINLNKGLPTAYFFIEDVYVV